MIMNKRRRSGSGSAATISDESDECATPDRDVTPDMEESNEDGLPLVHLRANAIENSAAAGSTINNTTTTTNTVLTLSGRKRKKLDPSELCQQLYDSVRNVKKDDGTMLCDAFIRAPKRRSQPDYYEVVSDPIDLLRVQQKLKTDSYQNLEEIVSDFELIIKNAKAYYKPGSTEYDDACKLWDLLLANKQKIINELIEATANETLASNEARRRVGRPRKSMPIHEDDDEIDMFEELFAAIMTAVNEEEENRPYYVEFQLLPSRRLYPDYYAIIEDPIDLKTIASRIQNASYATLDDMEKDFLLMVKNACTYNEHGSQIYEDAKALKEVFESKKADLLSGTAIKTQSKQRGQSLSALIAATKEDPDLVDDLAASSPKQKEAIMTRIFNGLNNQPSVSSKDEPLGATLWRMPHPRWEKAFYEKVAKPISMSHIQKKIKNGGYPSFVALKADFELLCDNYLSVYENNTDHRLYVAAKQLKSLLDQSFATVITPPAQSPAAPLSNAPSVTAPDESDTLDTDTSSIMSSSNNTFNNSNLIVTPSTNSNLLAINTTPTASLVNATNPVVAPVVLNKVVKKVSSPRPVQPVTTTAPHLEIQRIPPQAKAKLNFHNALIKNKLQALHRHLIDHVYESRYPIENFIELPSRDEYPDYYEIIEQPLDMTMIDENIKNDKYSSIDEALADYRKMFANCRKYNLEGSQIYSDAVLLEKALLDKVKELTQVVTTPTPAPTPAPTRKLSVSTTNGGTIRSVPRPPPIATYSRTVTTTTTAATTVSEPKLRPFYDTIRDYRDLRTSRQLAMSFMRLPPSSDYPDYYEIVQNPIDMERIFNKVKTLSYSSIEDLNADFLLMLRNACTYYEPDTPQFKDAAELLRVCFQTVRNLRADEVPDVPKTVYNLLYCLFMSVLCHTDADGRLYADSFGDVPDHDLVDGRKVLGKTLSLVRRRIEKGIYKRFDQFQDDLFGCFDRIRKMSKVEAQAFEDSIELQTYYISKRDELCQKGELLSSPALSYTTAQLSATIEAIRQQKLAQDVIEIEDDGMPILEGDSMIINEKLYSPGDFLYYVCPELGGLPGIMCVERLWINPEGVPMMSGNLFLRPAQVVHSRHRRFIDKEVFKSDKHVAMPLNKLQGKCYVMSVKDYFKLRPEGFLERDLYVCESRYNSRTHAFKKIKTWNHVTNKIKLVQRENPVEMKRKHLQKLERSREELAELDANLQPKWPRKLNIAVTIHGVEEGRTYYEQYNLKSGLVLKTGDFVYTDSIDPHNPVVVQVCAIYETKDGNSFFRGPYLKHPKDLPSTVSRPFYKQEILLSTLTETTPTSAIIGKCCALEQQEYTTKRPTEIPEKDVYICESVYDEIKTQIRRLSKPGELKKVSHGSMVVVDEYLMFPKQIIPQKTPIEVLNAASENSKSQLASTDDADTSEFLDINEDSMDIESMLPETIVTSSPAAPRTPNIGSPAPSTIAESGEKQTRRSKTVTGFILFQSQYRKQRHEDNPGSTFGEVSRMLGEEWKNLSSAKRAFWKEKALKANEEARAQFQQDHPALFLNHTPRSSNADGTSKDGPTGLQMFNHMRENLQPNQVFDCCWDKCNYEFEDPQELLEHSLGSKAACITGNITRGSDGMKVYECKWRTCNRIKRSLTAFPDWPRLLRHVREVHIYRNPGKIVQPEQRSINFVPRKSSPPSRTGTPVAFDSKPGTPTVPSPTVSPGLSLSQMIESSAPVPTTNVTVTAGPTPDPIFVSCPPRTQRVLHSDAYIRYIENLQSKSNSTSSSSSSSTSVNANSYQRQLQATADSVPPSNVDVAKLPTQWLDKRAQEKPEEVVNALWNLRNLMMKDVFSLYRIN